VIGVFSSVLALEGVPKCKNEAKVRGMAEHEGTTAIVSGMHIHPCLVMFCRMLSLSFFFVCQMMVSPLIQFIFRLFYTICLCWRGPVFFGVFR
jgi:hypothetical protein